MDDKRIRQCLLLTFISRDSLFLISFAVMSQKRTGHLWLKNNTLSKKNLRVLSTLSFSYYFFLS